MTAMSAITVSTANSFSSEPTSITEPFPDVVETPAYHSKYYIQDEMSTFLVENHIFRIHHHFLVRESEKFRSIVMRPRESVDSAIPLPGVSCLEFESLMEFFYEGMHDTFAPSIDEWVALLSVSTSFNMEKVRRRAIHKIDQHTPAVDPVTKVVLAKEYKIEGWLAPAYVALCDRVEPLEVWEAEELGLETFAKLVHAREKVIRSAEGKSNLLPAHSSIDLFGAPSSDAVGSRTLSIVNDVFWPVANEEPAAGVLSGTKNWKGKKGLKGKKKGTVLSVPPA